MAQIEVVPTPCTFNNRHDTQSKTANDDSSTDGSVDTQEAFLDMLGLSGGLASMENVEEEEEQFKDDTDHTRIQHSKISLPSRCSRYLYPPENCLALSIDNFYSKLECDQLIRRAASATEQGFQYITEAAHISPDGSSYPVKLQNPNPHKLSVFYHPPTISRMWRKLKDCIDPLIESFIERENCGPPLGLNPRLRVLRYDCCDNDRFEPHFDATTMVGQKQKSLLTVLLYLNDGGGKEFEGGDTLYLDSHISSKNQIETLMYKATENISKVTPESGRVVIFEHDLFHSGAPLLSGTKYVLRTDVLFAAKDDDSELGKNDDNDDNNMEEVPSTILVSDLCKDLEVPDQVMEQLDGMSMLEMTLASFLAPGITMLKTMLLDEISDVSLVDQIVHTAYKVLKK
jgi:hypothetical protein